MSQRQKLGLGASAALLFGTFCPVMQLPIVGSVSLESLLGRREMRIPLPASPGFEKRPLRIKGVASQSSILGEIRWHR